MCKGSKPALTAEDWLKNAILFSSSPLFKEQPFILGNTASEERCVGTAQSAKNEKHAYLKFKFQDFILRKI